MNPCLIKYADLYLPPDMLNALVHNPQQVIDCCNGVGPGTWIRHIIPDTVWWLDITPASDIHDWQYTYPRDADISYKNEADRTFLNNMLRLIQAAYEDSWMSKNWWSRWLAYIIRWRRSVRAMAYYRAVADLGGPSFWNGKNVVYSQIHNISSSPEYQLQ